LRSSVTLVFMQAVIKARGRLIKSLSVATVVWLYVSGYIISFFADIDFCQPSFNKPCPEYSSLHLQTIVT